MRLEIILMKTILSSELRVGDCFVWWNPRSKTEHPLSYHYTEDKERKVVLRKTGAEIEWGTYDYNSHGGWSVIGTSHNLGEKVTLVSCENQQP